MIAASAATAAMMTANWIPCIAPPESAAAVGGEDGGEDRGPKKQAAV